VRWLNKIVALAVALVWLPAVSCCLIDASGLLEKRECCSKEHSRAVPGPGNCDKPCGALASAAYVPQQSQLLVIAPIGLPLFDFADLLTAIQSPVRISHDFPATAPPELAGHWQFSFRSALSPRAPSLTS
jgi:hypothetical protein